MARIKIKRLTPTAKIPSRAFVTDTGYDLYAESTEYFDFPPRIKVHTGIAVQPEPGYYVEIFPRSSISKKFLLLANSVGIIDESYTGEIVFMFYPVPTGVIRAETDELVYPAEAGILAGEKIGQMVVRKRFDADFVEVQELGWTPRGDGGFGSTGK